ncbi:hypothetical protein BDQ17DRAFT_352844 [Cyathus striatus]|nr:hypothetical protein BDQ17DRAFT_352844 [Cyathus striatus]
MESFIYAAFIAVLLFMIVGVIALWGHEGARATVRELLTYNRYNFRLPTPPSNSTVVEAAIFPVVAISFPRPVVMGLRDRNDGAQSYNITVPLYKRGIFRSLGKRNAPLIIRWRSFFRVPRQASLPPV